MILHNGTNTIKDGYTMPPGVLFRFDEDNNSPEFQHIYIEGFFTQVRSSAISVVASLTVVNGNLKGWRAYIGASKTGTREENLILTAQYGNPIDYRLARAFFPNTKHFPKKLFDNGW